MRRLAFALLAVVATALAAAAPATAAHHEEMLMEQEEALWAGWKNADTAAFEKYMAADAVGILGDGSTHGKADMVAMIGSGACEVSSYELSDMKVLPTGKDSVVLVYRAEQDAVCDGEPVPSHLVVSSTWAMAGGDWRNVLYQETVVHQHEEPAEPDDPGDGDPPIDQDEP